MTGVLHHHRLLIALVVIANGLAAHVDDLRERIGTGTETETEMTVIGRGEAGPLIGEEAQLPNAEGTTAIVTVHELLQLKMTRRMIEKKIGLRPLPMIIKSKFLFHTVSVFVYLFFDLKIRVSYLMLSFIRDACPSFV